MRLIDICIIGIVIMCIIFALQSFRKNRKDSCCATSTTASNKQLSDPILYTKIITIQGMHCDQCSQSIQQALNTIQGISSIVSYANENAIISYTKEVPDSIVIQKIEKLGYKVKSIK